MLKSFFILAAGDVTLLVNKITYDTSYFNTTRSINETDIIFTQANKTQLNVTFESGVGATIDVFSNQLTIQISATLSLYNRTTGLVGPINDDQSDDLTRPDGTQIPINSTQETIYYQFGKLCK